MGESWDDDVHASGSGMCNIYPNYAMMVQLSSLKTSIKVPSSATLNMHEVQWSTKITFMSYDPLSNIDKEAVRQYERAISSSGFEEWGWPTRAIAQPYDNMPPWPKETIRMSEALAFRIANLLERTPDECDWDDFGFPEFLQRIYNEPQSEAIHYVNSSQACGDEASVPERKRDTHVDSNGLNSVSYTHLTLPTTPYV